MRKIVIIFLILGILTGCSPVEIARLAGVGTLGFTQKGKIYSEVFDRNLSKCYKQTREFIDEIGATFYRGSQSKKFIIAIGFDKSFRRSSGSTEVAVFFEKVGSGKTKVKVSSLNYSLSEFVSKKLFEVLNNK